MWDVLSLGRFVPWDVLYLGAFSGLGICSFHHKLFALSFKIAHFKEQPIAIRSCCSLQKSDRERFALVTLYKRAMWVICLWFEWIAHKKRAICSKSSLLMTIERRDQFALFHKRNAFSLTKNERIAWKTDEWIPNPGRFVLRTLCLRMFCLGTFWLCTIEHWIS